MAPSLFIQLASLNCVAAMQSVLQSAHRPTLAHHAHKGKSTQPYRQPLANLEDVLYTGEIDVGGQTLHGILDTGSFELLVLSTECQVCGDPSKLFSSDESETYKKGNASTEHDFGSGATFSFEAFDTVSVGPLKSQKQHFWQVYDAMMPVLEQSPFQAIVGVGPPDSARKLAEESEEMEEEMDEEDIMEEDYEEDVEEVFAARRKKHSSSKEAFAAHGEKNSSSKAAAAGSDPLSVCSRFDVQTFSVCFGKDTGSDGYFIWNDEKPSERGSNFKSIAVSGEIHWAANMTDVQVGLSGDEESMALGCEDGCAAVLDSGTSLIAAPMEIIERVEGAIQMLKEDCSNLGEMPDLVFTLAGEQYSLPPDAYIGQIVNKGKPGLKDILHFHRHSTHYTCVPLFMNMDVLSQLGPMWILGLPFFRKYYTTFSYDVEKSGLIKKSMAAAVADDACEPAEGSHLSAMADRRYMRPKVIDLAQLRVPQWVERAIQKGTLRL